MWYPGEHCWNIENSSILFSLKNGFVFLTAIKCEFEHCETNVKNLKLKIAENQQLEKDTIAFCLCQKQLLFQ